MVAKHRVLEKPVCLVLLLVHIHVMASTQFTSHVSVITPTRSFTHGVGDPISVISRQSYRKRQEPFSHINFQRHSGLSSSFGGYTQMRPAIPFNNEDIPRETSVTAMGWHNNNYEETIPILPPSPYKVDSPDPESLWPEGLFLPPSSPPRFSSAGRRLDDDSNIFDPYLLEGTEAIAAVQKAKRHGQLYFHEIPHIQSLLANQELRAKNRLKPHLIASIRHTWPYNRP